jgi:hypothetical protein
MRFQAFAVWIGFYPQALGERDNRDDPFRIFKLYRVRRAGMGNEFLRYLQNSRLTDVNGLRAAGILRY